MWGISWEAEKGSIGLLRMNLLLALVDYFVCLLVGWLVGSLVILISKCSVDW
jgi:hypothetical protein